MYGHKIGKYRYICSNCGYERGGLLDSPYYSCVCPECGGVYRTDYVYGSTPECTNNIRDISNKSDSGC